MNEPNGGIDAFPAGGGEAPPGAGIGAFALAGKEGLSFTAAGVYSSWKIYPKQIVRGILCT
jgi:hypothetical protein